MAGRRLGDARRDRGVGWMEEAGSGWKMRWARAGGARRRTGCGGRTRGVARRRRTRGARGPRWDRRARSRRTWRAACRGAMASARRRVSGGGYLPDNSDGTKSSSIASLALRTSPNRVLRDLGRRVSLKTSGVEPGDGARHTSPRVHPSSATCLPPRVARSFAPPPPRRARVPPSRKLLPGTVPTRRLGFSPSRRARPSRHPGRSPPPREPSLWISRWRARPLRAPASTFVDADSPTPATKALQPRHPSIPNAASPLRRSPRRARPSLPRI